MRYLLTLLILLTTLLTACNTSTPPKSRPPQGGDTPEAAVLDWLAATQQIATSQVEMLAIQPASRAVLVAYDYPKDGKTHHALAVTTIDEGRSSTASKPVWQVGQIIETSAEQKVGDLLTFHQGGTQVGQQNIYVVWGRALSDQARHVSIIANGAEFETPIFTKGFIIFVPVLGQPTAALTRVEARDAARQPLTAWEAPPS
jgi:hypothetical protein